MLENACRNFFGYLFPEVFHRFGFNTNWTPLKNHHWGLYVNQRSKFPGIIRHFHNCKRKKFQEASYFQLKNKCFLQRSFCRFVFSDNREWHLQMFLRKLTRQRSRVAGLNITVNELRFSTFKHENKNMQL